MNLSNFNREDYWCYQAFNPVKKILEIRIGKYGSSDVILRKYRKLTDYEIEHSFHSIVDETIQECFKELENEQ
nr:MAG TPA: hypothetical protein [Caudoviricetes sp.]